MTVEQLIEKLKEMHPKANVLILDGFDLVVEDVKDVGMIKGAPCVELVSSEYEE